MLGRAAGVELERLLQGADRTLAVAEKLEDPDPDGVAEDPEEVGLDAVDRLRATLRDERRGLAHCLSVT